MFKNELLQSTFLWQKSLDVAKQDNTISSLQRHGSITFIRHYTFRNLTVNRQGNGSRRAISVHPATDLKQSGYIPGTPVHTQHYMTLVISPHIRGEYISSLHFSAAHLLH